jgi:hypothetical protein
MRHLQIAVLLLVGVAGLPAGSALAGREPRTFGDRERHAVLEYYNAQMKAGSCPIGFARRDDGCELPGHSRSWQVGKPIPANAIRFDVPAALAARLGKPPAGHRYVRVGPDILLVSNRTKLVVDGILDLGRR